MHPRCQRVRFGSEVARKVDQRLQRVLEAVRRARRRGTGDGALQLGERGEERGRRARCGIWGVI
jgi:hypothetical protein